MNPRMEASVVEEEIEGTQTLERGSYIDGAKSCNIITLRRRNGRISEVASRAKKLVTKVPLGAHF